MKVKNKIFLILLILMITFVSGEIYANDIIIEKTSLKEAVPGHFITIVFPIRYNGEKKLTVNTDYRVPEKWSVLSPISKFTLHKDERNILFLTLLVPQGTKPDIYKVGLSIEDKSGHIIEEITEIEVLPLVSLKMINLTENVNVHPGKSVELSTKIINEGNIKANVNLKIDKPFDWEIEGFKEKIAIEAGSSSVISYKLTPPKGIKAGLYSLSVFARSKESRYHLISSSLSLLPPYPEQVGGSIWWQIPGEMNLNSNWVEENSTETEGSISLAGSLPKERWIIFDWEQDLDSEISWPTLSVGKKDIWFIKGGEIIQGPDVAQINGPGVQYGIKITPHFFLKNGLISEMINYMV